MADALAASPLVSRSPLAGTFRQSRGFALVFRRRGLQQLARRFDFLLPFVDAALDPAATRALRSWHQRLRRRLTEPNAFYLNLLLVPVGCGVGQHVDATLRAHCGDPLALPFAVSVLYLRVPPGGHGGELVLQRDGRPLRRVRPAPGMLVHFRGELSHGVQTFTHPDPQALRMSLVLEQYALDAAALGPMPELGVHSKAGFAAYLAEQRGRPAKQFVVD